MDAVTIIAYVIAIAIPAFTVYLFVALDVFGTGKLSTILISGAWGASGAFLLAWTVNNAVLDQGIGYDVLTRLAAPVIEEMLKAFILIMLIQQPRFRYIVDGAVYGIAVGIGFALSENLFIYLPRSDEAVLGTAISRTLSTSLMHAAASGMVGLSLGRLRRVTKDAQRTWPFVGISLAIILHVVYNNIAGELEGIALLLVAIGIGMIGGIFIGWQISQGLEQEKKRFSDVLRHADVADAEVMAIQRLGGAPIEQVFGELSEFFGGESIAAIRRLMVLQANIGILQNNLKTEVSERLRTAWEKEIAEYKQEFQTIRKNLDGSVRLFVSGVFFSGDTAMETAFVEEIAKFDPTLVHTFDMFMRVSELAANFTPEELAARAEQLRKIEIFEHVSLANLENLSRAIVPQSYEAGYTLFEEGQKGDAMYMLEDGEIDIFVTDHTGQDKHLRTFRAGQVVGEFSLLDGRERSARAKARTPIQVLTLQRQVFFQFIQSRPTVVLAMLQYLAGKVRFTTQSVERSLAWCTKISEGDYQPPQSLEATLPAPSRAQAALSVDTGGERVVEFEPSELSAETVERVERVLSQTAAALQERENSMRSQAQAG
ncbi:MAG: PrsW family intramembrane metalloprotease [Anaerolineae bacterium]|nr:PrsW family intramembrane metalloprotease [Anaerolineae bacterium]